VRPAAAAFLVVAAWLSVGVPDALGAEFSATRTEQVQYEPGNSGRNGYESASVDVKYRFGECFSTVDLQFVLIPDTLRAQDYYWYRGKRWGLPETMVPDPVRTVDFRGRVAGSGGPYTFSLLAGTNAPSCLDAHALAPFATFWQDGATGADKKAALERLSLSTASSGFRAPPLTSRTAERYISGLIKEEEEKALEAKREQAEAKARAEREKEEQAAAALEAEEERVAALRAEEERVAALRAEEERAQTAAAGGEDAGGTDATTGDPLPDDPEAAAAELASTEKGGLEAPTAENRQKVDARQPQEEEEREDEADEAPPVPVCSAWSYENEGDKALVRQDFDGARRAYARAQEVCYSSGVTAKIAAIDQRNEALSELAHGWVAAASEMDDNDVPRWWGYGLAYKSATTPSPDPRALPVRSAFASMAFCRYIAAEMRVGYAASPVFEATVRDVNETEVGQIQLQDEGLFIGASGGGCIPLEHLYPYVVGNFDLPIEGERTMLGSEWELQSDDTTALGGRLGVTAGLMVKIPVVNIGLGASFGYTHAMPNLSIGQRIVRASDGNDEFVVNSVLHSESGASSYWSWGVQAMYFLP
jgi:hypothetical protein